MKNTNERNYGTLFFDAWDGCIKDEITKKEFNVDFWVGGDEDPTYWYHPNNEEKRYLNYFISKVVKNKEELKTDWGDPVMLLKDGILYFNKDMPSLISRWMELNGDTNTKYSSICDKIVDIYYRELE